MHPAIRELALRILNTEAAVKRLSAGVIGKATMEGGFLGLRGQDGTDHGQLGLQPDGRYALTWRGQPVLPAANNVSAVGQVGSALVSWPGSVVGQGIYVPSSLAHGEVYATPAGDPFDVTHMVATMHPGSTAVPLEAGDWDIRIAAVDNSGQRGANSDPETVTVTAPSGGGGPAPTGPVKNLIYSASVPATYSPPKVNLGGVYGWRLFTFTIPRPTGRRLMLECDPFEMVISPSATPAENAVLRPSLWFTLDDSNYAGGRHPIVKTGPGGYLDPTTHGSPFGVPVFGFQATGFAGVPAGGATVQVSLMAEEIEAHPHMTRYSITSYNTPVRVYDMGPA